MHLLPAHGFDRYRNYPASRPDAWQEYARARLRDLADDSEWTFHLAGIEKNGSLLGCRISAWDLEHYGFKLGFLHVLARGEGSGANAAQEQTLRDCMEHFQSEGVGMVVTRVSGFDLFSIHSLEKHGFRYYETEVSPIVKVGPAHLQGDPDVRLMAEEDIEAVKRIAVRGQFPSGHYQLDGQLDQERVARMYAKWVESAWKRGEPVAVIAPEGTPLGYFIFRFSPDLSNALGLQFGSLRALAIDPDARGRALGRRLFNGTLALLGYGGAQFIESTYSTKNFVSAGLHTRAQFMSAYEEVTMHCWLNAKGART
ncbi:MAG: hypothetical protein H0W69_03600 [Gemmatimonadaceae bacterium]|nr:hypothetical protein [Gemmatimonadaceae bacterium]